MKNLLLTLGHNSSAILIEDGKIVWGYETERLSGIKSDSMFPHVILNHVKPFKPDIVYVSHWAPTGNLSSMAAKHWDPSVFDGVPVRTLSIDRSHHDAHIYAAVAYAGHLFPKTKAYGVVVDGFGILGEHFSIYDLSGNKPELLERTHGYNTSMGLWYQYATAFMGMKMHEDEYKLLGYEVHISPQTAELIKSDALIYAAKILEDMRKSIYKSIYDPVYDVSALAHVKEHIWNHLTTVCKKYDIQDPSTFTARCTLSFYVQSVLEAVVLTRIKKYNPRHLIVSGGVFYNVKLNKCLIDMVDGQFCAFPLAGDQGNALGLYAMDHSEFNIGNDLCWGVRDLHDKGDVKGLYVVDESTAYAMVQEKLKSVGYVNLVRGNMEFGPRALCNTSTLAMPTRYAVAKINAANNRNTVMPMAPVMNMGMYHNLFENTDKVWKSYKHMICAMEYKEHPENGMLGIAHEYNYPYRHHTGRPQVIDNSDPFMDNLIRWAQTPLINTSFNFHGVPIAFNMEDVIYSHRLQYNRDDSFTTVVIKNG